MMVLAALFTIEGIEKDEDFITSLGEMINANVSNERVKDALLFHQAA